MATPNPAIKGPGVLYVTSRISRDEILDEDTFFKWYDEDHIDEIVNTSGMRPYRFNHRARPKFGVNRNEIRFSVSRC